MSIQQLKISRTLSVNKSLVSRTLEVLLILLILMIILTTIWEVFSTYSLLMSAILVFSIKNFFPSRDGSRTYHINLLDVSMFSFILVELISFYESTYQANSFPHVIETLSLCLFYYLVRFSLRRDYLRITLFSILSLMAFCISLGAIITFFMQFQKVKALGFADPTDLKHTFSLFNHAGTPVGEWITIFLVLLPFPLAIFIRFNNLGFEKWLLLCPFFTILVAALLTFSRGVYAAIVAFSIIASVLFWFYRLAPLKRIIQFNLLSLLVLVSVLTLTSLPKSIITTFSLFNTASQVRSFEGRMNIWKQSAEIVSRHPWFGVGPNNFAMQYVAYKSQDGDAVFVGRAFNSFLQIFIEKGVLGLAAYIFLLAAFFIVSHRKIKLPGGEVYERCVIVLFMAAYAAVLVRELSYSSMMMNKGVAVLLWLMMGNNAQLEKMGD